MPVAHERHGEFAHREVRRNFRLLRVEGEDDFLERDASGAVRANGALGSAYGALGGGTLGHGVALDLNNLVDHGRGRLAGAGDHGRAHAVAVDWVAAQTRNGELIQVGGNNNARVVRAQVIELLAHAARHGTQVAGVDAHAAEFRARDLDGRLHALRNVVGVDEQGGVHAVRFNLRTESGLLVRRAVIVDVGERPRMRRRARSRNAVAVRCLKVRRGGKARKVRGAGRGDRGVLVRAARAHLDDRAAVCGHHHAGGCRCHRGVRVHDGQDDRFKDDAFAKRAAHGKQRRIREVELAFAVAVHLAGETVMTQILNRLLVEEVEVRELLLGEAEVLNGFEHARDARDHAVAALARQAAGENFESGLTVRGAVTQPCLKHGELVLIGQQARRAAGRGGNGGSRVIHAA